MGGPIDSESLVKCTSLTMRGEDEKEEAYPPAAGGDR